MLLFFYFFLFFYDRAMSSTWEIALKNNHYYYYYYNHWLNQFEYIANQKTLICNCFETVFCVASRQESWNSCWTTIVWRVSCLTTCLGQAHCFTLYHGRPTDAEMKIRFVWTCAVHKSAVVEPLQTSLHYNIVCHSDSVLVDTSVMQPLATLSKVQLMRLAFPHNLSLLDSTY